MYNQQGGYNEYPHGQQQQYSNNQNIHWTSPTNVQTQSPPQFQPIQPNFGGDPIAIENSLQNQKPSAPTLLWSRNDGTFGLPVKQVRIDGEFHIGTMFGKLFIIFNNNTNQKITGTFAFPTPGTVTNVDIQIGADRWMATTYVSQDDATKHLSGGRNRNSGVEEDPNARYIPDLFRVPVNNIKPGDDVVIELSWMQPVEFIAGRYNFELPLKFGPAILPYGVPINQIIDIRAKINCVVRGIQYGSSSHTLVLTSFENGRTELYAAPQPQNEASVDFHLAYSLETNQITAVVLNQPPNQESWDNRGSFVMFVNPPQYSEQVNPRDIIFLIDRSGSMAGRPWEDAATALTAAIGTLRSGDRFGIVCFDHEASFFNGSPQCGQPNVPPQFALYNYNDQTRNNAASFIRANPARGGTNINTPLIWAVDTLNMNQEPNRIPFVVLLTDGAVRDEKEICNVIQQKAGRVRVLTFGIGQHCNWYFLKTLALQTRGWSSGALSPEKLIPKMSALVNRAASPVLVNISVGIANLSECVMYPPVIPDLFIGGPLVIAGKYRGNFPQQIKVQGSLCDGRQVHLPVRTDHSKVVPVAKVFVKQQLDQLIAEEWLGNDPRLRKEIIDISLNEQLPTPHTTMVAYEMDAKQKARLEKEQKKNKGKHNKKGPSAATVAKYAGGAVAIVAGAVLIGSVAATLQGGSGFGAIGDVGGLDFGDIGGGDCCACCGDCGDCCGDLGSCFGDCCGDLGGCCGDLVGNLGDCCGEIGNCIADCPLDEICTGCIEIVGGILEGL